jgi:hypothetical protein
LQRISPTAVLKFDIVISLPFKSRAGVLPFLVATGLFQISSAFVSAPGPPSASTLEVLGPDSIQISYDPPISDGGSPVTSYTVITNAYQFVAPEHMLLIKAIHLLFTGRMGYKGGNS